jgi:lysophospholipase L1-like esterase
VLPDGDGCWPSLPVGSVDVAPLRDALSKFDAGHPNAKGEQAMADVVTKLVS